MKRKYSSIPFIPLKYNDINKAVENELILDTESNKLYIHKEDTHDLLDNLKNILKNDNDDSIEYGISIDMSEPDPKHAISYIGDAEGFKPLAINKDSGNCNYGSWKNILDNFFGVEPVLVKDGKVVAKLDPNDFNKILDEPFEKKAIYGFEYDINNERFIYTDDAVELGNVNVADDNVEYNGWKDIILNLIGIKPVTLSHDGTEIAHLDPFDYKKTSAQDNVGDDDIMIRFKHLYYHIDLSADKLVFKIASYKVDDTFVDDIFNGKNAFYVSAYNASVDIDGNLVSRTGTISKIDHDDNYFTDDILNKYLYMLFLGMLIGKSPTLSTLGFNKTENSTKTNGTMDEAGIFGQSNSSTKIFGAENLLGNNIGMSASVYADGNVLRYNVADENENVNIKVKRVIHIESKELAYSNIPNASFCTGDNDILIYLKVPVRIFK